MVNVSVVLWIFFLGFWIISICIPVTVLSILMGISGIDFEEKLENDYNDIIVYSYEDWGDK